MSNELILEHDVLLSGIAHHTSADSFHGHLQSPLRRLSLTPMVDDALRANNNMSDEHDQDEPLLNNPCIEERIQQRPHMEWWRVRGGFERIIFSRLNPLKVCARHVVREFDCLSQQLQLVYCSSLIYANKMAQFSAIDHHSGGSGNGSGGATTDMDQGMNHGMPWSSSAPFLQQQQHLAPPPPSIIETSVQSSSEQMMMAQQSLGVGKTVDIPLDDIIESFFPFDPYYEQLSFRKDLDGLYVRWNPTSNSEEEDEEDEDDDDHSSDNNSDDNSS
jgi:hypothetical protein